MYLNYYLEGIDLPRLTSYMFFNITVMRLWAAVEYASKMVSVILSYIGQLVVSTVSVLPLMVY